jgi:hypothetical protein
MVENQLMPNGMPPNGIPEEFCDGIGQVSLARGMIRVELLTPSDKRGRAEAPPEPGLRLILSAEGFLRVFDALDRSLRDSGMVSPEPAPGAADAMRQAGPRSPNFPHVVRP